MDLPHQARSAVVKMLQSCQTRRRQRVSRRSALPASAATRAMVPRRPPSKGLRRVAIVTWRSLGRYQHSKLTLQLGAGGAISS